jgi:hypothetical protein
MSKRIDISDQTAPGDPSPELVPVVEAGSMVLALLQTACVAGAGEIALDGLLSDVLFGEVIDISDLIPRVLSPSDDAATPGISAASAAEPMQPGLNDGGDILAAAGEVAVLTILYDDGILVSDGMIL